MSRVLVASGLALWAGTTLLLSEIRWFSRPSLGDRLRPYAPAGVTPGRARSPLSAESLGAALRPLAEDVGARLSALLGISEDLQRRLERIHSPLDVSAFRVRQLGWSLAAAGFGALLAAALHPPPLVIVLLLVGTPLLAFLVLEQQTLTASRRWQRRVFLELPVVAEQLAMLLSAGYSLTAALNRVATRGQGACARDLQRVCRRVRQGLGETEALREWQATVAVESVDRLVPVLALGREASDLGRLLSEEARAIRRDVQRELVEAVERRGQQVWIPVTVATLVPGVVFLAVPFIEALRLFAQ
jgi:tight adherence protein C